MQFRTLPKAVTCRRLNLHLELFISNFEGFVPPLTFDRETEKQKARKEERERERERDREKGR